MKEEALQYAELVKTNEKNKDSSLYMAAESIIAYFISDEDDKSRKLTSIKNKADRKGYFTLKANIILAIANGKIDVKQLDKIILEAKDDVYTKVRALLTKAKIVLDSKAINEINEQDLLGLNISYSYSFYQRLELLLTNSHILFWGFWFKQHRYDQLLNLFRYSSFVWRLCGELEIEKEY